MSTALSTRDGLLGRSNGHGVAWRAGGGSVAAVLAASVGLPVDGRPVDAALTVRSGRYGDRWTRRFGRRVWSTTCTPTTDGFIEWMGSGARRPWLGLDLVVAERGDRATIRLRALRLGPVVVGRPFGLRVHATLDSAGDALAFIVAITLAGRTLLAYEGWIR
jgi:hypothetical protein